MNQEEVNKKILEIMNNRNLLSQEEIELFKELMFQCDLKIQNKYSWTPLMFVLNYNKSQNLNLNKKQLDYLIKNSDLKQQADKGYTSLMYALSINKNQTLNLTTNQWDYLIKNSDLTQKNINGMTPFMYALNNNRNQNLQLTIQQFKTLYDALNEDQQQTIFQNIIQKRYKNDDQYLEYINLFLYNCEFKPNEKTIKHLKENKYQDIMQMIEKRDVFFQLNQDFKKINKKEKIDKMKI